MFSIFRLFDCVRTLFVVADALHFLQFSIWILSKAFDDDGEEREQSDRNNNNEIYMKCFQIECHCNESRHDIKSWVCVIADAGVLHRIADKPGPSLSVRLQNLVKTTC